MATITSAQSGNWNTPATWVGDVVPDLSQDDVIIDVSHTVTMRDTNYTLTNEHSITINSGATLSVQTGFNITGSSDIVIYGRLVILSGKTLSLSNLSTIDVYNDLQITGNLEVTSGGVITVYSGGDCIIYSGGIVSISGNNSMLAITGSSSMLKINAGGIVEIVGSGKLYLSNNAVGTFHGLCRLYSSGFLQIDSSAKVYVRHDIEIAGIMIGGGEIFMLRRDGAINGINGTRLFRIDSAYGYRQKMIA